MALILPLDIFLKILEHADQQTKYKMGLTCQFLSSYALQKLWNTPTITKITSLSLLVATLRSRRTFYQYKKWITGLAIHIISTENLSEPVPDRLFMPLSSLRLKKLSLQQIDILLDTSGKTIKLTSSFESFLNSQLKKGIEEIRLSQCAPDIIHSLIEATRINNKHDLQTLDVCECLMDDPHLEFLVKFYPKLKNLKLDRCGCFSDQGLLAVAQHCQEIQTLVVTLPSYFIQSNTITTKTIDALTLHCPKLKRFVCDGQVRILEYIKEQQEHTFSISTYV